MTLASVSTGCSVYILARLRISSVNPTSLGSFVKQVSRSVAQCFTLSYISSVIFLSACCDYAFLKVTNYDTISRAEFSF